MVVVAVKPLPLREVFSGVSKLSLSSPSSSSPSTAASSPEELPSMEPRGVPVVISVITDWLREVSVAVAAE